jgi:DNA-binding winged helix-turn-helix (wHTH) protein/alpha-beta hydrolase superfamily lysophospholipase
LQYCFEDFLLDPRRRELSRNGNLINVEPLVFDLLHFLVQRRDRVTSKDELIASVWNGRIVSESTLTSRINAARQAIDDDGEHQRLIKTLPRRGFRFVGETRELNSPGKRTAEVNYHSAQPVSQAVTYSKTNDGFNLAVASAGSGPSLVRAAHWATSADYDWDDPLTGPLLHHLANRFRVIRYDGRGIGLSDRDVPEITFPTMLDDLEAVINSTRVERFALLGISGGAATSIAYAVKHPERVSKLVLFGGYARGRNKRGSPQDVEEAKAFLTMLRSGWGNEHSVFMRAFSSFFIPGAPPELIKSFIEFQRVSTTGENAIKLRMAVDDIDVFDQLGKVSVPTIVFHCTRDNLVPFNQGQQLAAGIPNSKFVRLISANHALLSDEPAWTTFISELDAFLADSG